VSIIYIMIIRSSSDYMIDDGQGMTYIQICQLEVRCYEIFITKVIFFVLFYRLNNRDTLSWIQVWTDLFLYFHLYPQLVVGGLIPYLRHLCLFVHNDVQHILCCVFVLFIFDLPTLWCQFLWVVNFWLPLRYSLTFISNVPQSVEKPKWLYFTDFSLTPSRKGAGVEIQHTTFQANRLISFKVHFS